MKPATETRTKLTPPELARRWGISVEKVLRWIETGELKAANFASSLALKRPRWKIDIADALAFEQSRMCIPPTKPAPRRPRKTDTGIIEFFK
jgi:hypothetical protein